MKTWQKILIAAGVAAGGFTLYKKLKPSPFEGMLVKGTGNDIYLVQNNRRRYVPTIEILNALKAQGAPSLTISDQELLAIPNGLTMA